MYLRRFFALLGVGVASLSASLIASGGCTTTPTFVDDAALSAGGSGGGTGMACTAASDCPGEEGECQHKTCQAGRCGVVNLPDGFLVATQASGDCKKAVCDGNGRKKTITDQNDPPNDANGCTLDRCSPTGDPSNPPAMKDTPCGAMSTLKCDGSGKCTGCMAAADCGVDSDCVAYTCDQGSCGTTFAAKGKVVTTGDMKGDCHQHQCNGNGGVDVVVDNTDVPDAPGTCSKGVCNAGSPAIQDFAPGTACGGNSKCDDMGNCLGCTKDTDCGQSSMCATFTCQASACSHTYAPAGTVVGNDGIPGNCRKLVCDGNGSTTSGPDDSDTPNDNNACTADQCSNGVATNNPLMAGTGCGGSLKCDGAGTCVGCINAGDCPGSTSCQSYSCQMSQCIPSNVPYGGGSFNQVPGDCVRIACDGGGNQTSILDSSDFVDDGNGCTDDYCAGSTPTHSPVGAGTGCPGGVCNGGGGCVQCINDQMCGASTTCMTYQCVNGGCQANPVGYGADAGGNIPGDCLQNICNGMGSAVTVANDGDFFPDANLCDTESCAGGVLQHTPIPIADDGNDCTDNVCDPATGSISYPPVPDGSWCQGGGGCFICYTGYCNYVCGGF
jgi:hypothetical protein